MQHFSDRIFFNKEKYSKRRCCIMHLSYQEHRKIYRGLCDQKSIRAIAKLIDRDQSVVSREIRRNSDEIGYLTPEEAYRRQQEKKGKRTKKIDRDTKLQEYIVEKLKLKWSPKVIA